MKNIVRYIICAALAICMTNQSYGQSVRLIRVGDGYADTSVNTAIFRANSLFTHDSIQYVSYYDADGCLTLGKRNIDSEKWTLSTTQYKGNVKDAHNVICMGVDGEGYLHVAFDHHGHPLRYAKSTTPGGLELGELESMTGVDEGNVTYPEFYRLSNGDLLFVYRSGASGRGNMAINRYDVKSKKWLRVQDTLIDGENERSPYWQVHVDANDVIHVSWVWRESWLVETNHDLCYAKSLDGGMTWLKSDGTPYTLPITASNAEYACRIPQNSELINQTSMVADDSSRPYIATYWRSAGDSIPQYRLVWNDGEKWRQKVISNRRQPFSLSGGGTKMIPISRPRIIVDGDFIGVIFRDKERDSKVSIASTNDGPTGSWRTTDLTDFSVDAWEPSIDSEAWRKSRTLSLFLQRTSQGDGEKTISTGPTPIYILETDKIKSCIKS